MPSAPSIDFSKTDISSTSDVILILDAAFARFGLFADHQFSYSYF